MNNTFFPLAFSDVFGVPHPAAVAMVSAINMQRSVSIGVDGTESVGHSTLTYQVRFWHSEAARASGAQPQLIGPDGQYGMFTLSGDAAVRPHSEWCEACRAHFETVVAPTLSPAESAT